MTKRILLVDDSAFICNAVGGALRAAGFAVDVATDLFAFEDEQATKPDLVLMDVVLQEAYGDEVAELLRATRGLTCPILLFSALPDAELADRARDAGLDGFIAKRGGMPALVARINEALGGTATAPAAPAHDFQVQARQRVRRVVHVLAQAAQWSAAAIAGEMQALAGDADLVGATAIAAAARTCREAVIHQGSAGWTPEIGATINVLSGLVDDKQPRGRILLVIEDRDLTQQTLPHFDAEGAIVFEARTLAEARQKLRTADYDAILLDGAIENGSGHQLIPEIRTRLPSTKIAIVESPGASTAGVDASLPQSLPAAQLAERVLGLVR